MLSPSISIVLKDTVFDETEGSYSMRILVPHLLAQKANLFCSRLRLTAETQIGVGGQLEVTKYSIHRDDSRLDNMGWQITVGHVERIELRFNPGDPAATSSASLQRIDDMLW
jgi:hypothetical protein